MSKKLLLERQHQIQTPVQRVILRSPPIHSEQVGQSCSGEPMTMQPPLAARREQSIDGEDAQHLLPVGALAAWREAGTKKIIEVKRAPQFVGQPARTPLTRMLQAQFTQPHLQPFHLARRQRAICRKQRQLPRLPVPLVNHRDRPLPRLPLAAVDLPKG